MDKEILTEILSKASFSTQASVLVILSHFIKSAREKEITFTDPHGAQCVRKLTAEECLDWIAEACEIAANKMDEDIKKEGIPGGK